MAQNATCFWNMVIVANRFWNMIDQRVKKKLVLEGFEIKPTEKKDRILF